MCLKQIMAVPNSFVRKFPENPYIRFISDAFGRFRTLSDGFRTAFGWLSDVFGRLSDVFGWLSDGFRMVFGRLLAIVDGFSLILTAFRYRERRFADRPYPFFFAFFLLVRSAKKKMHDTKTGAWWITFAERQKKECSTIPTRR